LNRKKNPLGKVLLLVIGQLSQTSVSDRLSAVAAASHAAFVLMSA